MRVTGKKIITAIVVIAAVGWQGIGAFRKADTSEIRQGALDAVADIASEASKESSGGIAVPGHRGVSIPSYSGKAYAEVNRNRPFITDSELSRATFIRLSDKDSLGRPQVAFACLDRSTMPETKRESIGMIKPAGWHTYNMPELKKLGSDSNYLYNRCHLIGFQLSGLNADDRNLVTGTRQLNTSNDAEGDGMLKWENETADYMRETGNHVMYRVTPVYQGSSLLCEGVLMEARSVEDGRLSFCVFIYNEQHGVKINHQTGEARLS